VTQHGAGAAALSVWHIAWIAANRLLHYGTRDGDLVAIADTARSALEPPSMEANAEAHSVRRHAITFVWRGSAFNFSAGRTHARLWSREDSA
jgi:hypothetical protein